jgi:hypothetical protein
MGAAGQMTLANFGSGHDDRPEQAETDREPNGIFHEPENLADLPIGKAPEARFATNTAVGFEAEQAERKFVRALARIGNGSARALRTLAVRHCFVILEGEPQILNMGWAMGVNVGRSSPQKSQLAVSPGLVEQKCSNDSAHWELFSDCELG